MMSFRSLVSMACKIKILLGGFVMMAALSLMVVPAQAQQDVSEKLPTLTITPDEYSMHPSIFRSPGLPEFKYPNAYLNDRLSLQYQNTILQKMIVRQGTIARTEASFIEVGVPFKEPPPPRGICEQLPVNVPCFKAYPDLYPGALPEVGQIEEGALETPAIAAANYTIPVIETAQREAPPPPPEQTSLIDDYNWADITCAAGKCTAVIVKGNSRQSVKTGDSLPDGLRILSISNVGVRVELDGKTQDLRSALAPSRGGVASPKFGGNRGKGYVDNFKPTGSLSEQTDQIEDNFAKKSKKSRSTAKKESEDADSQAPEAAIEPVAATAPVNDPGPPLGPTGLY